MSHTKQYAPNDKAKINNMLVSGNMTPQKWVGR